MRKLTAKVIKQTIAKELGIAMLGQLILFLSENDATDIYFDTVLKMYNELGYSMFYNYKDDPVSTFQLDASCSGDYELVSCFADYDKAPDGREYWEELNEKWQKLLDNR